MNPHHNPVHSDLMSDAWHSLRRRFVPWLAVALGVFGAEAHALRLQGVLMDSDFPAPGSYRLEILETGDTTAVVPGTPFSVTLPQDTLWTLCVRKGVPPAHFEKCFEVRRHGRDTVFAARIGDLAVNGTDAAAPAGIVVAEPGLGLDAGTDTTAAEAEEPVETMAAASDDAVRLQKVVVRAQRTPKRAMGRETVSAKLIKRMPGLGEADVIRSIQGLPGVVASSDFSTKIYVRGGGSDQNLILFDNAPVFSPTHFFGLFSTFLVEGVDDVTFYKGGFSPEYGNRLSSVLDIKSRRGGKDGSDTTVPENTWFEGSSVKISSFASQAHTEGRHGPVRWLFAGRTTYIRQVVDYLRDRGLTDLTLDYYFYDLQGNVAVDLGGGEGRELMFSLYQGRDKLNFDPFFVEWGNTVAPLNLKWRFSNVWDSRTTLSYSLLSQSFGLASIFELYNNIVTWQGRQVLTYTGIDDHRLEFGAAVERTGVVFRDTEYVGGFVQRDDTDMWLTSAFVQDAWSPTPVWTISPGVRFNYVSTLNEADAEPRLSLKRVLPANQAVDAHVGRYIQYVNSILFSDQENLNEFYYPAQRAKYRTVKPASSWLFSLGYAREHIFDAYSFSLEGYYKTLHHLLVNGSSSDIPDSIANDPEARFGDSFKEAEGYSYGYETTLRKPEGRFTWGVSYSSGTAVIREQNFDEAYYPKWHQPHSLKVDLGVNWIGSDGLKAPSKRGGYFRSSSQIKYATGLPYTEIVGHQPAHLIDQNDGRGSGGPSAVFPDNTQTVNGNYNQGFVPSYFRWDVKPVDWGREGKWNFSFTILNITNHENVFFYSYDRQKNPPERVTVTQFPLFPFLMSYEYYF